MDLLPAALPYLICAGGVCVGSIVTWLIYRSRVATERVRSEERRKAADKAIVDLEAGAANLEAEVQQLRHTERALLKRQGELEVLLQTQQKSLAEKQQLLQETERRMAQHFKSLSAEVLKSSQQEFLHVARTAFEGQKKEAASELEQRRIAVETLVRPVAQSLDHVQNRITELERARQKAYSGLVEQVRQLAGTQLDLQRETAALVKALRQPATRGQWGDIQLRRVVELAGMQDHCDFVTAGPGPSRTPDPDLIVNLPAGKQIVVDSKAPMDAYFEASQTDDEAVRAEALKRHAARIADHMRQLSSEQFRGRLPADPEFTVLFLPSESFFSAALTQDPTLIEKGMEAGVVLATPITLIALLRAVAAGWRQEAVAENARRISEAGRELYSKVRTLAGDFSGVGRSLDAAVKSYNKTVGALDTRVLPSARRLHDLGAAPENAALPEVAEIETLPREPRNLPGPAEHGASCPSSEHGRSEEPPAVEEPRATASLAATGELDEDSFEGFTGPENDDPHARPAASSQSESNDASHPADDPDPEGAAGDLRAALAGK